MTHPPATSLHASPPLTNNFWALFDIVLFDSWLLPSGQSLMTVTNIPMIPCKKLKGDSKLQHLGHCYLVMIQGKESARHLTTPTLNIMKFSSSKQPNNLHHLFQLWLSLVILYIVSQSFYWTLDT